ncbi:MAG: laccase domain-containing protein [Candidatus Saccharimonadales bacterium]
MTHFVIDISTVADGSIYNRHDPKDPEIIANRERYLARHTISMEQTTRLNINMLVRATVEHDTNYCRYSEVTDQQKGNGMRDDDAQIADALVTTKTNHALFLPVADCVGATFYDPEHSVLMVSHLGRHSLEQQGAIKSVEYLKDHYKSDPSNILVWLTPAPGKDVYPIWALDNKGMKEATFEQLDAAGINPKNITDNSADSTKDPNYFSYSEFLKGNRDIDGDHVMIAMMRD